MTWLLVVVGAIVFVFGAVVFRGAPYVPSRQRDVSQAFDELYALDEADTLVDIGSGDGIVLRLAADRGAKAIGYELNPILVLISRFFSRHHPGVTVHWADFWRQSLPSTVTIVYVFGESRDIEKMANWLEKQATRLNKSIYFISYGFKLKRPVMRSNKSFNLYTIEPLQSRQPQV